MPDAPGTRKKPTNKKPEKSAQKSHTSGAEAGVRKVPSVAPKSTGIPRKQEPKGTGIPRKQGSKDVIPRKQESKAGIPRKQESSAVDEKNKVSKVSKVSVVRSGPSKGGPVSGDGNMSGVGVADELFDLIGKALTQFTWYHGLMPRQDCQELLKEDGDFVVRRTKRANMSLFCISAKAGNEHKHIPLNYKDGKWVLFKNACGTLKELIDLLLDEGKPIGNTGVTLKKGIARPEFYILHENIITDKKLGAGAFGEVFTGTLRLEDNKEIKVAVKKAKGQVSKQQLNQFVKEAMTMKRICHFNCIRLYGVAPQEVPFMIVLELAAGGSLKTYFKKHPDCREEQLISFLRDAARGMCYLASCQVIHRDLAARNCLLNEQHVLKISDFGLSVTDTPELKLKQLKAVPIRWLSPETLTQGVFNTKTDVWSYGVLTWEIFSRCKTDPFPYDTNAKAKEKILSLQQPMDPPQGSPSLVRSVFDACFVKDPAKRADFPGVLKIVAPDEKPPSAV